MTEIDKAIDYRIQVAEALLAAARVVVGSARAPALEKLFVPENFLRTVGAPKNPAHGDYACGVAFQLAAALKKPPADIAQALIDNFISPASVATITAARGFVDITLTPAAKTQVVTDILSAGIAPGAGDALPLAAYGRAKPTGKTVLLEFVSANPTGPLHVGHGRAAAVGDALARILDFAGLTVQREYYINDAGRQAEILATSAWLRYFRGFNGELPPGLYQGAYMAQLLEDSEVRMALESAQSPDWEALSGQIKDKSLDAGVDFLNSACQAAFGTPTAAAAFVGQMSAAGLALIKKDLAAFGIAPFTTWVSEQTLHQTGKIDLVVQQLKAQAPEYIYSADGALWLRTTQLGDDKDRVLQRQDGRWTYFAADLAYHADKLRRLTAQGQPSTLINILGADHHGYVPRLAGAVSLLPAGTMRPNLEALMIQLVALIRDGVRIKMSTRAGDFIPLVELIDEIGRDSARYFYVMRKNDQHFELDLALAKSRNNKNPLFYLQYAHARAAGVFRTWHKKFGGVAIAAWERGEPPAPGLANILTASLEALSTDPAAVRLLDALRIFPTALATAATQRTVHSFANYLQDLAAALHNYYDKTRLLTTPNDPELPGRLALMLATKIMLRTGLTLLGVSAPEQMEPIDSPAN